MRIIGESTRNNCKVTLYHWNNRYLIKLEKDFLEQTFKINQFDVSGEGDLIKIMDENFVNEALQRFESMEQSLDRALQNL
jgi:hypothetical protein